MTNYYKLTIKGVKGQVYAIYKDGVLKMLINEQAQPQAVVHFYLKSMRETKWVIEEIKPKSVSSKAALFVLMFKEYRNVVYTPSKIELSNLRHVTMSEQLLKVYFAAKDYPLAGPKTISDYIRNYNAVRDLAANGKPVRTSFPDVYDREYEKTLGDNVGKLQAYWAHLRDLNWKKIDGVWTQNRLATKAHED